MTTLIADALREGTEILQQAGLADSRREASGLLQHILGRDRTFILAHPEHSLTPEQLQSFYESIQRRARGEPLQYITSHQSFFGLDFEVGQGVLIPRPETELLVETALGYLKESEPSLCDVGTGSGCIAITLLRECRNARGVAIDISATALKIAQRNAAHHGVADRLSFVQGNCFSSLARDEPTFDLIVSNPPYVADRELAGLQREVRDHEPREALSGGPDGLDVVRRLLQESGAFLKDDGYLLMEIGFNQSASVETLVDRNVWLFHDIRADLQGIPRVVVLQKRTT